MKRTPIYIFIAVSFAMRRAPTPRFRTPTIRHRKAPKCPMKPRYRFPPNDLRGGPHTSRRAGGSFFSPKLPRPAGAPQRAPAPFFCTIAGACSHALYRPMSAGVWDGALYFAPGRSVSPDGATGGESRTPKVTHLRGAAMRPYGGHPCLSTGFGRRRGIGGAVTREV